MWGTRLVRLAHGWSDGLGLMWRPSQRRSLPHSACDRPSCARQAYGLDRYVSVDCTFARLAKSAVRFRIIELLSSTGVDELDTRRRRRSSAPLKWTEREQRASLAVSSGAGTRPFSATNRALTEAGRGSVDWSTPGSPVK